jgi:hypothetical protein
MSISEEALEAMRLFMRETAAANKAIHDAALAFITATAPPKKELEHRSESSPGRVTSPDISHYRCMIERI